MPRLFVENLVQMLEALVEAFPENRGVASFLKDIKFMQGTPEKELEIIQRWHYEMLHDAATGAERPVPLYLSVEDCDFHALATSGQWVFMNMHANRVFFHTHMPEEERTEFLDEYVHDLNTIAFVYAVIPTEAKRAVMGSLHDLIDSAAPVNADTLTSAAQRVWEANPDNIMSWTTHMSRALVEPYAKGILMHALDMPMLQPILEHLGLGADQFGIVLQGLFTTLETSHAAMESAMDAGEEPVRPPMDFATVFSGANAMLRTAVPNVGDLVDRLGFGGGGEGAADDVVALDDVPPLE
jgi:hypothetical protein